MEPLVHILLLSRWCMRMAVWGRKSFLFGLHWKKRGKKWKIWWFLLDWASSGSELSHPLPAYLRFHKALFTPLPEQKSRHLPHFSGTLPALSFHLVVNAKTNYKQSHQQLWCKAAPWKDHDWVSAPCLDPNPNAACTTHLLQGKLGRCSLLQIKGTCLLLLTREGYF